MNQQLINSVLRVCTISDRALQRYCDAHVDKYYQKGECFLKPGETPSLEGFVVKGCFKTFRIDESGKESILYFALENWRLTDLFSYTRRTTSELYIQSIEKSHVMIMTYEDQQVLFKEEPELERFYRIMCQMSLGVYHRMVLDLKSYDAIKRYQILLDKYPEWETRIPQYMIASYLGISPEFLSKTKKKLGQNRKT